MQVISNQDETIRLFKSDVFEFFTRVHWSVPLWLFVPVLLYALYQAFTLGFWGPTLLAYGGGLAFWTLLEYGMHRFFFHRKPQSRLGKRLLFLFHGIHHAYPSDSWRLVMPPAVSIPLALVFDQLFHGLLPTAIAHASFAGLVSGYLGYDMIHYATHHRKMKGPWIKFLKQYHLRHHFQDEERGYGVSSPLWDYVFRTRLS